MPNFDKIIRHIGKHLDDLETIVDEFLAEIFTSSTRDSTLFSDGLIEQWEEEFGIDDPAALIADRRAELNAKVRSVGGDNFDYFKDIAAGLGYNIDSATNPHLRITDGDYPPARAEYAQADISQVWDQDSGASSLTWCVRGTSVETDTVLQGLFESQKPEGTEIQFINE
ncbi:MAG TPA: putative phage tail protein [Bacteroidales bacterium]|nr:putative phage tail protein [Bacteroidales bacterium]